jgi:hypothetical protein
LASASARSAEATCSSNSASSARHVLVAVLDGAHGGFGAIEPGIGAPATASRSAAVRFLASSASATLNRSASFCRAASFSFSAFSKRSIGPSSRLKNAMAIPPRVTIIRRITRPIRSCEN